MKIFRLSILLLIALSILLAGCTQKDTTDKGTPSSSEERQDTPMQVANPASVYCTDNGGELVIEDTPEGQYGICIFEDGTTCEEWAYYRGECP